MVNSRSFCEPLDSRGSLWGIAGILAILSATAAGCNGLAARARNAEGVRQFDQAQYPAAMMQFQQAIYADPSNADSYYNMARVYHRLGTLQGRQSDLVQAESYYRQCLERDANHSEGYRGLAVLLAEQNRPEEAYRLLEGWADRNPTSAEPKVELARLLQERGQGDAAMERLTEALVLEPGHSRALAALGQLREQKGQSALALKLYQDSLKANPYQPEVAARVAALQTKVPGAVAPATPAGNTRVVSRGTGTLR